MVISALAFYSLSTVFHICVYSSFYFTQSKKFLSFYFCFVCFFFYFFFLFCLNEILTEKITYELATEIRFHWKWFCTMCCWTRKGNCISFTSLLRRKPLNKSTQMAKLWSKRMANATEKIFSFFFSKIFAHWIKYNMYVYIFSNGLDYYLIFSMRFFSRFC